MRHGYSTLMALSESLVTLHIWYSLYNWLLSLIGTLLLTGYSLSSALSVLMVVDHTTLHRPVGWTDEVGVTGDCEDVWLGWWCAMLYLICYVVVVG